MSVFRFTLTGFVPFITALGLGTRLLSAEPVSLPRVELTCATNQVGKYEKIDFSINARGSWTNPFDPEEIDLSLHLTTPSGKELVVPAFWYQPYERRHVEPGSTREWMYPNGPAHWNARFAPTEIGRYTAKALLKDPHDTGQSESVIFTAVPSAQKGFVRVSTKDRRFLEFSEGQPFFMIGQNLAFIGNEQYVKLTKAEHIFAELATNGANYLRVWTCCDDWAMAIESRKSAFGRSWDWHPSIVPVPGAEASGRQCLRLSTDTPLKIEPSHPVALRPGTTYVFSGKALAKPRASLRAELNGHSTALPMQPRDSTWQSFRYEFQSGSNQWWLAPVSLHAEGSEPILVADLSLRDFTGGPELLWEADVNRPTIGYYNQLDSFMLDELVAAAEQNGIYLQLCFLARDLYMHRLKEPTSTDYDHAIRDAQKALRYAVARWGYSTSVAAWEYWNEMDPKLPTTRFYSELAHYLDQTDPYKHLRTTSTWGPSEKDCRQSELDIADVHFYLRPVDKGRLEDEVDAVLERTRWLRAQAPHKPAHLGEFGLANDKWQPRDEMNRSPEIVDFHNALWASALSGASGTAMSWWWERLDQRQAYSHYGPLSRFISDVPWNSGELRVAEVTCSEPGVRVVGLRSNRRAWLWLFNRQASWSKIVVDRRRPEKVSRARLELKGMPAGSNYSIEWYDTRQGRSLKQETCTVENELLRWAVLEFTQDVACRLKATD